MDVNDVLVALSGFATGVLALLVVLRSHVLPALAALAGLTKTTKDDDVIKAIDAAINRAIKSLQQASDKDGKVTVAAALDAFGVALDSKDGDAK